MKIATRKECEPVAADNTITRFERLITRKLEVSRTRRLAVC
jgi:hypothetical protein